MASRKHLKHAKAEAWSKHLEEWRGSGLRVAEFCQQRGLKVSQFYDWRSRLLPSTEPVARNFRKLPAQPHPKAFIPVTVTPSATLAAEFVLGQKLILRLAGPMDAQSLAALARALQAAGC